MKLKTIEKHRHRRLAICDAAIDLGRLRDAVEDQDDWEAIMAHVLSPTSELDDSFRPGAIAASKVLDTLKRAVGAPEYSGAEQEVSELLENAEELKALEEERAAWVAVYVGAIGIRERLDALRKKWGAAKFDEDSVELDVFDKLELEPRELSRRKEIELAKYDATAQVLAILGALKTRFGKDYEEYDVESEVLNLLEQTPRELAQGREHEELRWGMVAALKQENEAIAKRAGSWDASDVEERLYELVGGED